MKHFRNIRKTAASLAIMAGLATSFSAAADIVQNDDVIITFSLCVGNDCVNGENFGFDTVRIKENNTRLHFDDTSSSASFPANDWRLIANDSGNGGANYFAIEDATAGRIPFRVEAGAPANALYVEDDGDVGIKTSTPIVDLHIVEGNTPTVRLDQDGSDGFTPQVWDLAGNETNFFVRDVTNGSKLSLRIRPNSPESSVDIHPDRVDFSTKLRVLGSGAGTWELVSRADGEFALNDTATTGADFVFKTADTGANNPWEIVHRGDNALGLNSPTTAGAEFFLNPDGDLTIRGTLTTNGPTCSGGCDAVFDAGYDLPSIQDHASAMFANGYLPAVGATEPYAPINVTEYVGNMLNELEKAHIYIAELDSRNRDLEARLARIEASIGQ